MCLHRAKGVFAMAFFLGCDVCKTKIDLALVDESNQVLWQDKVPNEPFQLATYLLTLSGAYPKERITGVVEATGRYHYPLLDAAVAVGFACKVYNPILTKQGIKASVRGKKTDKTDAVLIARLGARGEGNVYTPEPYMTTKLQVRSYAKLRQLEWNLRQHTEHLAAMDEEAMTERVQAVFDNVNKAIREAQVELYRELRSSAAGDIFRQLQTIPGVGPFVAACLIGEIQDMVRFKRPERLVAYVGLDPKIRQSGHSLNSTGRLTKRGSPHARRALFIAANVARQHDPHCKSLYERKRSEGKTYKVAVCAVARKLLTIIRAVWLSGGDYDSSLWTA
jgi:transposase